MINKETKVLESDNILLELLKWAWVALLGFFWHVYRKISGIEARELVIANQMENFEKQRAEDLERYKEERKEMLERSEKHHTVIMNKLDKLTGS